MSHLLENMTPPPHGWSCMGGGLDITTPFGEHDTPMDKRRGGGLRTTVALALLLVRKSDTK